MIGGWKILYATDARELDVGQIDDLVAFSDLGVEEIVLLHGGKVGPLFDERLGLLEMDIKVITAHNLSVSSILAVARDKGAAMVAFSLGKDRGRSLIRSHTRLLYKRAHVPVIALPQNGRARSSARPGVMNHVIFATAWSESSEKALAFLLSFGDVIQALEIVHVIDRRLSVRDMRQLKDRLTGCREKFHLHGIDSEAHVYAGKPWEEIVRAARDYEGSCVVMGATRRLGMKYPVSNSCSSRVTSVSLLPTLVVP
jgi:nucleotide-binding universal stress UspA family protein